MANRRYLEVEHTYGKSKEILMSVVRNTSCDGGWLRLVVQVVFGLIIVCSFILISLLTIHSHYQSGSRSVEHCIIQNCQVICNDVPLFGEYENEILQATSNTEPSCGNIVLTLNNAMFHNCTLPGEWLSAIRASVTDLEIVGGNLRTIRRETFLSPFGGMIKVIVLKNIIINTLAADTFIGLSSLKELHIIDSEIINIRRNALEAVDDTLQVINIKATNHWDPVNVTGSSDLSQLHTVDFSHNQFDDILGKHSFSNLKKCTVLFLNSCNIISIGAGAFDALTSIEILHLNNNHIISLPDDIFNTIIPHQPRISLQENLWNCTCYSNLRFLFKLGLLIVEPTCFYPLAFRGKKFSAFEKHCQNVPSPTLINENLYVFTSKSISAINHHCANFSRETYSLEVGSPLPIFTCLSNVYDQSIKIADHPRIVDLFSTENNWLKPSFSVDSNAFSMVSLVFSEPYDYGLLWYHSTCPKEIYCINHLPKILRVYNEDLTTEYTFCRTSVTVAGIKRDKCVAYNLSSLTNSNAFFYKSVILTVCIAIICLLSGALCVYALIHRNPILLKGNKRVVFVKHKTVDALVLPAKTSLRDNLPKDPNKSVRTCSDIFVIPKTNTFPSEKLSRANSVRTNESNDPSYISALQPTEDQLAEWRITRNFEATYAYDSTDSNLSTQTQIFNANTLPYYTYDTTEYIYDTVKL